MHRVFCFLFFSSPEYILVLILERQGVGAERERERINIDQLAPVLALTKNLTCTLLLHGYNQLSHPARAQSYFSWISLTLGLAEQTQGSAS